MTTATDLPPRQFLDIADRLAPPPDSRDTAVRSHWARHYTALALAAWAVFRDQVDGLPTDGEPGSRPDIGYLAQTAVAATAAACALMTGPSTVARELWDLTPEAGALNGEYIDWLAERCDQFGINPADLYPWFDAADFDSPTSAAADA